MASQFITGHPPLGKILYPPLPMITNDQQRSAYAEREWSTFVFLISIAVTKRWWWSNWTHCTAGSREVGGGGLSCDGEGVVMGRAW